MAKTRNSEKEEERIGRRRETLREGKGCN